MGYPGVGFPQIDGGESHSQLISQLPPQGQALFVQGTRQRIVALVVRHNSKIAER